MHIFQTDRVCSFQEKLENMHCQDIREALHHKKRHKNNGVLLFTYTRRDEYALQRRNVVLLLPQKLDLRRTTMGKSLPRRTMPDLKRRIGSRTQTLSLIATTSPREAIRTNLLVPRGKTRQVGRSPADKDGPSWGRPEWPTSVVGKDCCAGKAPRRHSVTKALASRLSTRANAKTPRATGSQGFGSAV